MALSTGWYDNASRCLKHINVTANGHSVLALVVDECDSTVGCDKDHDYEPPSANNVVSASSAVWKALDVRHDQWSGLHFPGRICALKISSEQWQLNHSHACCKRFTTFGPLTGRLLPN